MNSNQNSNQHTSQHTGTVGRIRTFVRYAWGDQVAAHRALLRYPAYDDYLFNHRSEH
jgi:hypothetical protein